MMTTAGEWYTSGTFWAAFAAIGTVLGIPLSVWGAYWIANPKRRLTWDFGATAVLPSRAANAVRTTLEVRHNGRVIVDPHLLEVVLHNDGRRDIPSEAFDAGQPLKVDVGAPILELLPPSSKPPGYRIPSITVEDSTLQIGPGLIAKGQRLTLFFFTDGRTTHPSIDAALIDVRVRQREPEKLHRFVLREMYPMALMYLGVIVIYIAARLIGLIYN
jgi:hypothetical protein